MESFEQWIAKQLETRGWSQSEAARRSGISASMFSQVISGASKPGPDFLIGVARAFGLTRREVFERSGMIEPIPQTDETNMSEIGAAFTYLSPEEKGVWKGMLLTYVAERRRESEYATPDKGERCDTSKSSS